MTSEMIAMRLSRLQSGYATTISWRSVWRRGNVFQIEGCDGLLTFDLAVSELCG